MTEILKDSEGTITDKIIESGKDSEKNKEIVSEALVEVAEEDLDKVLDVLDNNEEADETIQVLKDKIENEEAVTVEDFEEVFKENVSPN